MKLISTLTLEENNDKINDLIKKLELNKDTSDLINYILRTNSRDELLESKQNSELKSSANKSRLNEIDLSNNDYIYNNYKFLKDRDLLFLWFVNCTENFKEIYYYFNNFFEPINVYIIKKETFGWAEDEFQKYLHKFFEFEKSE